ncbi:MAG: hypothetical protein AAF674_02770 [Pseudomonadota bacterium]
MSTVEARFQLVGSFNVQREDGEDITPRGAKARGLLALLVTTKDRKRSRRWLEGCLWSDRGEKQASGSLRQTLVEIRTAFGQQRDLVGADRFDVWLQPERIQVDFDHPVSFEEAGRDLLEGIEIRDEAFEDWLRDLRQQWRSRPSVVDQTPVSAERAAGTWPPSAPGYAKLRIACEAIGQASDGSRLVSRVVSQQIGQNIEERLSAWRIDGAHRLSAIRGDDTLKVRCEVVRSGSDWALVVDVVHLASGRILYSGLRTVSGDMAAAFSDELVTNFGHEAAAASVTRLPRMLSPDRPESIAASLNADALEKMRTFKTDDLQEAHKLLGMAFDAQEDGLHQAWRGFIRMAQVVDRLDGNQSEYLEETDQELRHALECTTDNSLTLALAGLTRLLLFDDIEDAEGLTNRALALNPRSVFARQTRAMAKAFCGDVQTAYELSKSCQDAIGNDSLRHLWDLYHCLICISLGHHKEAFSAGERASILCPEFLAPRRQLVALGLHCGMPARARKHADVLKETEPGFSLDRYLLDEDYPVITLRRAKLLGFSSDAFQPEP